MVVIDSIMMIIGFSAMLMSLTTEHLTCNSLISYIFAFVFAACCFISCSLISYSGGVFMAVAIIACFTKQYKRGDFHS